TLGIPEPRRVLARPGGQALAVGAESRVEIRADAALQAGDVAAALGIDDARTAVGPNREDALAVRTYGDAARSHEQAAQPARLRATGERALELARGWRQPGNVAARRKGLQGVAHGAVELLVLERAGGKTGVDQELASGDVVVLPDHVAEHRQDQERHAPQQARHLALVPRGRHLRAAHLLELQPLLAKPRGLRLLAGVAQRARRLGDLRRARFALRRPGLGGVEVVATQQERFRLAAREPARRKLAEPRVLADPVEVLPQRIGELPQRPRQPRPFVEANKLQAAQR